MDELCRHYNVSASQLSEWQNLFLEKGKDGFSKHPEERRLRGAQAIIGRQAMELDLYKKDGIDSTDTRKIAMELKQLRTPQQKRPWKPSVMQ